MKAKNVYVGTPVAELEYAAMEAIVPLVETLCQAYNVVPDALNPQASA